MTTQAKIMIVDDDPHICEIVQAYCEKEEFTTVVTHSSDDALKQLFSFKPDLIVLDVLLANDNGIDWCKQARNYTNAPIIFLSSREEDEVKISALTYGGDDYMTKPFSPGVLIAKIKAHLRRVSKGKNEQILKIDDITLDFFSQSVSVGGNSVFLSKKEFSLMSYMAQHVNQVVTVDALFQTVWGLESLEDTRTVAVHISNLRKKVEVNPIAPVRIVTVRGTGYMLVSKDSNKIEV